MIDDHRRIREEEDCTGLTEAEVQDRLEKDGYNELPSARKRRFWHILLDVVREPMFLMLIACGVLYLLLGDFEEALMLLGFVFVIIGITLYQEQKTERALEALRDLSSPRALVIRDGQQQTDRRPGGRARRHRARRRGRPRPGRRRPAGRHEPVSVDESLLTGESVPVRKAAWDGVLAMGRPGGDDLPFVYSGTMVVRAGDRPGASHRAPDRDRQDRQGPPDSRAGGNDAAEADRPDRPEFRPAGPGSVRGGRRGLRSDPGQIWSHGFLAGITLAMATLPEEFPVVLTIFLALGAWRISQHKVLTRRVPAVEMLGRGHGPVRRQDRDADAQPDDGDTSRRGRRRCTLCPDGRASRCPRRSHEIVEYAILASPADPFDPMEKAMRELGVRGPWRTRSTSTRIGRWSGSIRFPRISGHVACLALAGWHGLRRRRQGRSRGDRRSVPLRRAEERRALQRQVNEHGQRRACASSAWPRRASRPGRPARRASTISPSSSSVFSDSRIPVRPERPRGRGRSAAGPASASS